MSVRVFHAPSGRLNDARIADEGARKRTSLLSGKHFRDREGVYTTRRSKISPSQRVSPTFVQVIVLQLKSVVSHTWLYPSS